ncbi:SHOCT domain-containing protein [Limosilactobacillus fermentum]|uniref:SHOCT domain-containing protein n=1 Tax=Limosilactobacillus fermentum TaxID=1613 RepID=UPI0015EC96C2|nr:SHOCT domain-containing protein [Limosilactobacillus fermentum]
MNLTNEQVQNELLSQKAHELTQELLTKGLITPEVAQRLEQENRKSFTPLLNDLIPEYR